MGKRKSQQPPAVSLEPWRGDKWASSRMIAELMGKNHKDVLRDIRRMLSNGRNFALIAEPAGAVEAVLDSLQDKRIFHLSGGGRVYADTLPDKRNRQKKVFFLDAQAFALVTCNYHGARADAVKMQLFQLFLQAGAHRAEQATADWQAARVAGKVQRRELTDGLQALAEYAHKHGSRCTVQALSMSYTNMINKLAGIKSRDEAGGVVLALIQVAESKTAEIIRACIQAGADYHKPYQMSKEICRALFAAAGSPLRLSAA